MGDKAKCEVWSVKTLVFLFPLAGGVRSSGDYVGMTVGAECGVFDFHDGVFRRWIYSRNTVINFLKGAKEWKRNVKVQK